jgi:5-methylcytosine-specific restriction endonuclease McrA
VRKASATLSSVEHTFPEPARVRTAGTSYVKRRIAEIQAITGDFGPPKPPKSLLAYRKRIDRIRSNAEQSAHNAAIKAINHAHMVALQRSEILGRVVAKAPRAVRPTAPYKYPVNTGTCTYCGHTSFGFDHVIPYSYIGRAGKRRGSSDSGVKVPCCQECNTQLGRVLIVTVVDRAAYLLRKKKVHKRYSIERLEWLAELASHS